MNCSAESAGKLNHVDRLSERLSESGGLRSEWRCPFPISVDLAPMIIDIDRSVLGLVYLEPINSHSWVVRFDQLSAAIQRANT